jgi:probable HAF family extracellular repeat protein
MTMFRSIPLWFCIMILLSSTSRADYQLFDLGAGVIPASVSESGRIIGTRINPDGTFQAVVGTVDNLVLLPEGGSMSSAMAQNSRGDIVGVINGQAAYWPMGGNPILIPQTDGGNAVGISDAGRVIGSTFDPTASTSLRSFEWSLGSTIVFGSDTTTLKGISPSGLITGYDFDLLSGTWQTFRTGFPDLGSLGLGGFIPQAINDSGRVVGSAPDASGQTRAVLWTPETGIRAIGPTDRNSSASAISPNGTIAGFIVDPNAASFRATLWDSAGNPTDLTDSLLTVQGWQLLNANSVTDSGFIVGAGTFQGEGRGFLLAPVNPVPAPPMLMLFLSGGVSYLAVRCYRRKNS